MSADEAAGHPGSNSSKGPLLLILVNTLAIVAVAAGMAYVLLLYKHPTITETQERARLTAQQTEANLNAEPGRMDFVRTTVNIKSESSEAAGVTKLHYVLVRFSLQLRQEAMLAKIEPYKAVLADKILELIGNRSTQELNTVQGRYLLKTEILQELNQMAKLVLKMDVPVFTQIYFTEFLVQ